MRTPALPVGERKITPLSDRPVDKDRLAEYFGVSRRTIDYWVEKGRIPYIRIGNTVRFKIKDVERAGTKKSTTNEQHRAAS
jgi:excisionase family DNA binding protein